MPKAYKLAKLLELFKKREKNKNYRFSQMAAKRAKARNNRKALKKHQRRNGTDKQR